MKTLVVIGSGFSGAATAIEFLRRRGGDVKVIIINRSGKMAKGLAYGTNSVDHYLNVPAGNMSAFVNEPDSFLNYCRQFSPEVAGHSFMPRKLYGEYLLGLLTLELEKYAKTSSHIVADVLRIEPGSPNKLYLSDGTAIFADHVVLALGNFSPRWPQLLSGLVDQPQCIIDPWATDKFPVSCDEPVLLLGTGLTALDTLVSLKCQGHRGTVHMLSRRGLIPKPHRVGGAPLAATLALQKRLLATRPTILCYLREVRNCISEHQLAGGDWRDVLASLRRVTPQLWQRLPFMEQKRFLRHLQAMWDVHRHRVAPRTYEVFNEAVMDGRVQIINGRVDSVTRDGTLFQVKYRARGTFEVRELTVNSIINCTGPNLNLTWVDDLLIRQLTSEGFIVRDGHGIGVNVDNELSAIDQDGRPITWLSYVGPMLRAGRWEATAVPELREHSLALAQRLARIL